MKAVVLEQTNEFPNYKVYKDPVMVQGERLVKILSAALNHRDVWIMKGLYAGIQLPYIPGSDGICKIGNKRFVINPGLSWGTNEKSQSEDFSILGMPRNGTFAEFVAVPEENLFSCPSHLSDDQAAALPLAGVTAYRALIVKCNVQAGEKVLIHGIGGGVATLAMLFALSCGAEVWVTSSKKEKIEKAIQLGAEGGFDYTETNWVQKAKFETQGMDIIVDSAGGESFSSLLKLAKPAGRIAIYGGSTGMIHHVSPQIIFWKQVSIYGTTMGSPKDFQDMLDFVSLHEVIPVIDSVYPLKEIEKAYRRMMDADQFGKIVLVVDKS